MLTASLVLLALRPDSPCMTHVQYKLSLPGVRAARCLACILVALYFVGAATAGVKREGPSIVRCEITRTIDAGSAAYLEDCVRAAEQPGYHALLVRVDTPGGSLEATRQIARAFLRAQ